LQRGFSLRVAQGRLLFNIRQRLLIGLDDVLKVNTFTTYLARRFWFHVGFILIPVLWQSMFDGFCFDREWITRILKKMKIAPHSTRTHKTPYSIFFFVPRHCRVYFFLFSCCVVTRWGLKVKDASSHAWSQKW
jgi:hypothetical protein